MDEFDVDDTDGIEIFEFIAMIKKYQEVYKLSDYEELVKSIKWVRFNSRSRTGNPCSILLSTISNGSFVRRKSAAKLVHEIMRKTVILQLFSGGWTQKEKALDTIKSKFLKLSAQRSEFNTLWRALWRAVSLFKCYQAQLKKNMNIWTQKGR